MSKKTAAIVGSGNIGTDLMFKLMRRSKNIEVRYMIGVDPASDGLARAARMGLTTSAEGVDWLLAQDELPDFVFECTSAKAHQINAPKYKAAGIHAIDLTPAAVGPVPVPGGEPRLPAGCPQRQHDHVRRTGHHTDRRRRVVGGPGGLRRDRRLDRLQSAGPGTRANVDEFTETTAKALEVVGGATRGKAIIIINPVEPPMIMRNTVYCSIPAAAAEPGELQDRIRVAIAEAVVRIQDYVPGYSLRVEPQFDAAREDWDGNGRVGIWIQVKGAADYLPEYAGNLDIITSAATRTADLLAERMDAALSSIPVGA